VSGAARLVTPLLEQLIRACDALGMWAPRHLAGEHLHEFHLANQEIAHRLCALRRMASWMDDSWQPAENDELELLWQGLQPESLAEAA
jgi:hypothetical protein